jgi:hypothetical protein
MAMGSNVYHASGTQYGFGGGTSYSCPLIAGVCALIIDANPNLTPMQVLQTLRSTASKSTNPDNQYGWGIIDALSAINQVILPVELTSFSGVYIDGKVNLNWVTATETNNYGFEIERRSDNSSYNKIGFIGGTGTSLNRVTYNFIDQNLLDNRYFYRLKQINFDGSFDYSNEVMVEIQSLSDFQLYQNYPNPFNPATKVKYYIAQSGFVKIALYDVLGNEIKTLLDKEVQQGMYELNINGTDLSSGLYFVRMNAGKTQQTIKISLVK